MQSLKNDAFEATFFAFSELNAEYPIFDQFTVQKFGNIYKSLI